MPQLNYKISALEQILSEKPLKQTEDGFHGRDYTISYQNVTFGYQTSRLGQDGTPMVSMKNVINNISFTANAGQKTALVGESGSGKSTLAKLLVHYYDVQSGEITIGDRTSVI